MNESHLFNIKTCKENINVLLTLNIINSATRVIAKNRLKNAFVSLNLK